jgi:recombination protein RecT
MSNQLTPVDSLKKTLTQMGSQFQMALPKHIPQERFVRALHTAINNNPDLAKADRNSLLGAAMKAASDGLVCDGRDAVIVTFNTKDGVKAQYMRMIGGILRLIRNSGELKTITAQIVHKNDKYRHWVDNNGEQLEHSFDDFSDRGDAVGVYSMAVTKDGGVYYDVMNRIELEKIKKSSKGGQYGPWSGDFYTEMWKKSSLRRLSKRLPMSTDLDAVLSDDDKAEFVNDQPAQSSQQPESSGDIVDVTPEPAQKKSKLETIVEASEVPI